MADGGRRHDRRARSRALEGLADFPRTAGALGRVLQIAARHVESDGVAVDVGQRSVGLDVRAARLQGHDELDFEMQILGPRRIGQRSRRQQVVGVLLEEERRLTVRIGAHLARMLGVVAADAVDAVHGKQLRRSP